MRIKVIIPNSSQEFRDEQAEHRRRVAMEGTSVDVVCLPRGPVSLESSTDEAYAAPYILDEVKKAEKEGYDAVTIDCAGDPVLRAAREVSNIPVMSGGEASRLLALALGDRFSVITVLSNTVDVIRSNIIASQLQGRLASVRSAEIPVLELKDQERAKASILREARKAIEEDGADVIVLGCTGMAKLAKEIQEELGVPVVEPATAAIKLAEIFIQMGLSHSKISFKTPPEKEIK
ncbi:MAG: AroM family protein [Candidatus Bathyarchaeia archaeon]|nr:aspartate/glutamate racemase family protein [Candidatus Bathyarchaeota archaeon]